MDIMEAMRARHSVRQYLDRPIEEYKAQALRENMETINKSTGLTFTLVLEEPRAFSGPLAHYGRFRGCRNYIVADGPAGSDEELGYYGEMLVLQAQMLGLNTCWVALTYRKKAVTVPSGPGKRVRMLIALGYGANQGVPHKNKPLSRLCRAGDDAPGWFRAGMEAAMTAPTAVNQQRFLFTLEGRRVKAEAPAGNLTKLDLGIVKYHFELGAGKDNFEWA